MTADGGGTGQARRRRTSRVLAVCAVLFGLLLMHGSPASAAEGCHGGAASMAPTSAAASMAHPRHEGGDGADFTAPFTDHHTLMRENARGTMGGGFRAQVYGGAHEHGDTCWATPARGGSPLAHAATGAAGGHASAQAGASGWTPHALGGGWRGPPSSGRAVLLRVGVART